MESIAACSTATPAGKPIHEETFWLEGEQLVLKLYDNGMRVVTGPDHRMLASWRDPGTVENALPLTIGDGADRPVKLYGMPDRQLHLTSGDYLVFDHLGLAVHLNNGRVAGWFRFRQG